MTEQRQECETVSLDGPPAVHPTAVVESGAVLEPGVRIGPYCVVSEIGRAHV